MNLKKKCLYLGLEINKPSLEKEIVHVPFIEISPIDFQNFAIRTSFEDLEEFSHMLFTSKNAVRIFFEALLHFQIPKEILAQKKLFAIGEATSLEIEKNGFCHQKIAPSFTQEGVIDLLEKEDLKNAYVFYPRSSKARPVLSCYLRVRNIRHKVCDLYETKTKNLPHLPKLEEFDEVIFTSPTTVEAFFSFYRNIPSHVELKAIGPITKQALSNRFFCNIL